MRKTFLTFISFYLWCGTVMANDPAICDNCITTQETLDVHPFLAYIPALILLVAFLFLLTRLLKFNLAEALSTDHDPNKKVPSISRLIAFISGISALIFSYGLFTFYTLVYIKTGCYPEIEKLTNALIALGIGVVPYSINKVAGAIERR